MIFSIEVSRVLEIKILVELLISITKRDINKRNNNNKNNKFI